VLAEHGGGARGVEDVGDALGAVAVELLDEAQLVEQLVAVEGAVAVPVGGVVEAEGDGGALGAVLALGGVSGVGDPGVEGGVDLGGEQGVGGVAVVFPGEEVIDVVPGGGLEGRARLGLIDEGEVGDGDAAAGEVAVAVAEGARRSRR
jgi:hypothetical protein